MVFKIFAQRVASIVNLYAKVKYFFGKIELGMGMNLVLRCLLDMRVAGFPVISDKR